MNEELEYEISASLSLNCQIFAVQGDVFTA
jgi:hypothetical protein